MDLKTYITAERGRATALAAKLVVSPSYLSQLANGQAPISPKRAVEIEQETDGLVTRKEMFPGDWPQIWPELAQASPT
jgi:DNA-binding transcriptional regulator YdaS (Cro superfamily)